MPTKTFISIIILIFLLAVGGFLWWYVSESKRTGSAETGIAQTLLNLFPFGQGPAILPDQQPTTDNGGEEEAVGSTALRQLTTEPIAGAVAITEGGKTGVRYIERATGNVYDLFIGSSAAKRASNTTVPRILEALWLPNASSTILRYLDSDNETAVTFLGTVTESEDQALQGTFLPRNIRALAVSPAGKIAYVVRSGSGARLLTANADGTGPVEIFSSPFDEWLLGWPATTTLTFLTKPSAGATGYFYFLDTNTQKLTKVLGGIMGLTALPNSALTEVVFSESSAQSLQLKRLTVKTGEITDLSLGALPADKCVWSTHEEHTIFCAAPIVIPEADYPDAWYQGTVFFDDDIWKVDTELGNAVLVDSLRDTIGAPIDAFRLFLSPDERYLFFTNKKDSTLWSLELTDN